MVELALTVLRGSGPFITLQHSRGGNWLLSDGEYACTSGWSVEGDDGDGIITAGHCDDMDEFEEPDVDPYSVTHIAGVQGDDGDRGGLVCLNSAARFDKWNRAAVR